MFSVQTARGTRPGLGNQTCYNIPSDQLLTSGNGGCSLDNGPKVKHNTAKQQIKKKTYKLMLYIPNLVHSNIVHSIMWRRFNSSPPPPHAPFYRQTPIYPGIPSFLTFFCPIFLNADPIKHGIKTGINS